MIKKFPKREKVIIQKGVNELLKLINEVKQCETYEEFGAFLESINDALDNGDSKYKNILKLLDLNNKVQSHILKKEYHNV